MSKSKNELKELINSQISEIIQSNQFQERLTFINENYSNLKQELLIRNTILELLNQFFL